MENIDQLTQSYYYDLPEHFIAKRPITGRDGSKLLVYKVATNEIIHTRFNQLPEYLSSDHHLVLNQSKVFPCRLLGQKNTGGKIELFLLSLVHEGGKYPCMIRSNGKKKVGDKFEFDKLIAEIVERSETGDFLVKFNLSHDELLNFLEHQAHIPIPPYIRSGVADEQDKEDYQTVYAKDTGSVAAPTAGLHFTPDLFDKIVAKGIQKSFVTLHVGAGTFKTVSAENIKDHKMHEELYSIEKDTLKKLNKNKKIIAVGTTTLRVLESSYHDEDGFKFKPKDDGLAGTDIFLYPGKKVKSISGLITNFHLPESTLLMLVSSLIGRVKALELYEEAKKMDYRFFSYGDGMLILR